MNPNNEAILEILAEAGVKDVQIGTAFLASEESPASQAWKEAFIGCGDAGTPACP